MIQMVLLHRARIRHRVINLGVGDFWILQGVWIVTLEHKLAVQG